MFVFATKKYGLISGSAFWLLRISLVCVPRVIYFDGNGLSAGKNRRSQPLQPSYKRDLELVGEEALPGRLGVGIGRYDSERVPGNTSSKTTDAFEPTTFAT